MRWRRPPSTRRPTRRAGGLFLRAGQQWRRRRGARLLLEAGFEVRCILVGQREKLTCDTRAMEARLAAAGGVLEPFTPDDPDFAAWCLKADVMVDAIFGIGLNTEVRGRPHRRSHDEHL